MKFSPKVLRILLAGYSFVMAGMLGNIVPTLYFDSVEQGASSEQIFILVVLLLSVVFTLIELHIRVDRKLVKDMAAEQAKKQDEKPATI